MSESAEGNDDYSHAKKLVLRAAKREAALSNTAVLTPDGMGSSIGADFSGLALKPDHIQRPCWTCPDGNIYLEAFHDLYLQAYDFLVAISEPLARPEFLHQYKLTPYSLYAAVATNIGTESIISVLERLSKNALPSQVKKFIRECTSKYGKAKLVLKHNKFYVESEYPEVLRELLRDPTIAQARIQEDVENVDDHGFLTQEKAEEMKENLHMLDEPDDDSEDEMEENDKEKKPAVVVAFQIDGTKVENVKRQAIELDYPLMEEYDFKNDVS
jgi:DNA excision repair protein ERCC-3